MPKSLKKSNEVVDLKKFSQKIRGTNDYKDPKSGWIISKNKGKSHGGSAWKLYNKGKKERIASLTSSGKVLRE
ncbi:hypothetical protein BUE63_14085 [Bacillus sp. MB353a]|uniref:Novel toxin 21 domain-containing protein n=1 Tax=Bacillus fungorum TaxID=2039284 RepID=A0A2G6Q4K3_9BACI|nr:hypothetical protein [Staphylococcus aureus]OWW09599.1 hypothetical protein BUE63_14085 [Bacillus sp. MB353a]PIE91754.1 hypothetical protein CO726_30440 [Bacillus fungorum]